MEVYGRTSIFVDDFDAEDADRHQNGLLVHHKIRHRRVTWRRCEANYLKSARKGMQISIVHPLALTE